MNAEDAAACQAHFKYLSNDEARDAYPLEEIQQEQDEI